MSHFESKDKNYETAPSNLCPNDNFYVVEYPGYVNNVDKAVESLGGEEKIFTVKKQ